MAFSFPSITLPKKAPRVCCTKVVGILLAIEGCATSHHRRRRVCNGSATRNYAHSTNHRFPSRGIVNAQPPLYASYRTWRQYAVEEAIPREPASFFIPVFVGRARCIVDGGFVAGIGP